MGWKTARLGWGLELEAPRAGICKHLEILAGLLTYFFTCLSHTLPLGMAGGQSPVACGSRWGPQLMFPNV